VRQGENQQAVTYEKFQFNQGMQAALDIADAGYRVTLVEREATIGGRMAQLDKTFPTLDCSA